MRNQSRTAMGPPPADGSHANSASGGVRIPLRGTTRYALVSPEDAERLSRYRWHIQRGYAVRVGRSPTTARARLIQMHREVCHADAGLQVDHVNGDPLDNRRQNLRAATPSQNTANRRKLRAKKSCPYFGVTWNKKVGMWQASCKHRGISVHVGVFGSAEMAARERDRVALRIWGSFCYLNFPEDRGRIMAQDGIEDAETPAARRAA